MSPRILATLAVALGSSGVFAACSRPTPASPTSAALTEAADLQTSHGSPVPGEYVLSFLDSSLSPVTTLPVLTAELILKGHVADLSGNPAQSGTITFQYCSYKGGPANDITRPDEAPLSACLSGTAAWANLRSLSVNQNGDALLDFGIVRLPRTVGFRFKYKGMAGSIASGISAPADFTWTN